MDEHASRKGTTTVGVVYADGVVLAADKRATMGYLIANKKVEKIIKITDNIALTIAGSVSDAQQLSSLLRAEMELYQMNNNQEPTANTAASLLSNILQSRPSYMPFMVQFIIAGTNNDGSFIIYTLDPTGSSIEETNFYSTGSGSPMAFGVLEDTYEESLDKSGAIMLAARAINSAIKRDIATGEGIDVIVIDKNGYAKVDKEIIANAIAK